MRMAASTEAGRAGRDVLDNPVFAALTGPHADHAERVGGACRYPGDVAPFLALPDEPTPADWRAAAELIGSGPAGWLFRTTLTLPAGWEIVGEMDAVQMVAERRTSERRVAGQGAAGQGASERRAAGQGEGGPAGSAAGEPADDLAVVELTAADVPEMLALVRRTEPGPLRERTVELGRYLGIRRGGDLVAMAGERMRAPGWTEVSAVCTDPAYRGTGLASRLVRAVRAGIAGRGDRAFLHADAGNTTAIRLYQRLGFTVRTRMVIAGVQPTP